MFTEGEPGTPFRSVFHSPDDCLIKENDEAFRSSLRSRTEQRGEGSFIAKTPGWDADKLRVWMLTEIAPIRLSRPRRLSMKQLLKNLKDLLHSAVSRVAESNPLLEMSVRFEHQIWVCGPNWHFFRCQIEEVVSEPLSSLLGRLNSSVWREINIQYLHARPSAVNSIHGRVRNPIRSSNASAIRGLSGWTREKNRKCNKWNGFASSTARRRFWSSESSRRDIFHLQLFSGFPWQKNRRQKLFFPSSSRHILPPLL
jgi:hypothetical protein